MPPTADSRPRSDERVVAPLGRRACEVTDNRQTGGYRIFSALDAAGPEPRAGQFYMLAAAEHWGTRSGRPYLPRAFSVAEAAVTDSGVRLDFLVEDVGPGTERLASLRQGERLWVTGPLGRPFSHTSELNSEAAGAILVGGGIGLAPLAILWPFAADAHIQWFANVDLSTAPRTPWDVMTNPSFAGLALLAIAVLAIAGAADAWLTRFAPSCR